MKKLVVLAAFIAFANLSFGAGGTPTLANQGAPGNQGPWPVTVTGNTGNDAGFAISTTPLPCVSPVDTFTTPGNAVDGGASPCPVTQTANRRSIVMCNSPRNYGSPKITVRIDGTAPTISPFSPGQVLQTGDCYTLIANSSIVPQCIADVADAGLTITECR